MPDAQQHVGDVDNVWVRSYDAKTGELSNEFRAVKYKPTRGGEVKVDRPEAKFYMGKAEPRQVMVLTGDTGTVIVPTSSTPKQRTRGGPSQAPPSRGEPVSSARPTC